MASTHLVKYLVAIIMNMCPLDEAGEILPMRSSPHCEKGHGVIIGCSS
jgi:hypothetical protein